MKRREEFRCHMSNQSESLSRGSFVQHTSEQLFPMSASKKWAHEQQTVTQFT